MTAQRAPVAPRGDRELAAAVGDGDESAFAEVVVRHDATLVRMARAMVGDAAAGAVARETWRRVVRDIEGFAGDITLRAWILRIMAGVAGERPEAEPDPPAGPAVDPERFDADGRWARGPADWGRIPRRTRADGDTAARVREAIAALPAAQRRVIVLRDVEGCGAAEVREMLGLSDELQRRHLNRARAAVRAALEEHLAAG